MKLKCKTGKIYRKGYTKRLKNKKIYVPPNCIKAQSQFGEKRTNYDKILLGAKTKTHKIINRMFGTPKCKRGYMVRNGYIKDGFTVKSYTRKNGTKVKKHKVKQSIVPATCIKSTGQTKKKGNQLFILNTGDLTKYGYHSRKTKEERHKSLIRALRHIKPLSLFRKLNVLYVLNKNKNPKLANKFKNDADWVKTTKQYLNR